MREITGYPQMPPMEQRELDEFLAGPHLARLSTINEDGTPHTMPIWYAWIDGRVLVSCQVNQKKVRNIERDNRVTVLVDTADHPYRGVMIQGIATPDTDNALEKRIPIFERYCGTREAAIEAAEDLAAKWDPVVVSIEPTNIISFDYRKGSLRPL